MVILCAIIYIQDMPRGVETFHPQRHLFACRCHKGMCPISTWGVVVGIGTTCIIEWYHLTSDQISGFTVLGSIKEEFAISRGQNTALVGLYRIHEIHRISCYWRLNSAGGSYFVVYEVKILIIPINVLCCTIIGGCGQTGILSIAYHIVVYGHIIGNHRFGEGNFDFDQIVSILRQL